MNNTLTKLTTAIASSCALGLATVPMVSQAEDAECDFIYGVHDGGLNDSQLLRYSKATGLVEPLGDVLRSHDIEALDISKDPVKLHGASGDDTSDPGYLYTFDIKTGAKTSEKATGCNQLSGISFNPKDGSLWGWDKTQGLVQITNGTCSEPVVSSKKGFEVEALSWDNAGKVLYFAYNDHNGAPPGDANAKHYLGKYEAGIVTWNVCNIAAPEIEALEMLNDDRLLVGYHENGRQLTKLVNTETCQTTTDDSVDKTAFTDIEGLAVCLPEANKASCPSVEGVWEYKDGGKECGLSQLCVDNGNCYLSLRELNNKGIVDLMVLWGVVGRSFRVKWVEGRCAFAYGLYGGIYVWVEVDVVVRGESVVLVGEGACWTAERKSE